VRLASVVIPTYNRSRDLERVLDQLEQQAVDEPWEPELVVDDGSGDGTWEVITGRRRTFRWPMRAVRQANAGPARARNRGVDEARGEVVLFLGDDTVPCPGWLAHHLEEHRVHGRSGELAVLGYTGFPPADDTPFARFINEGGAQFGYGLIDRPREVPFNFFYTSNISLPRQTLVRLGGFREDFPAAAWEDIELAYRAVSQGLRIVYQPRARVVHHHAVSPARFCRRQRTSGRSAAIFARLHPELGEFLGLGRLGRVERMGRLAGPLEWLLRLGVSVGELVPGLVPDRVRLSLLDLAYLRGLAAGRAAPAGAGVPGAEGARAAGPQGSSGRRAPGVSGKASPLDSDSM
jgi:GT2 family glycosyltransferase